MISFPPTADPDASRELMRSLGRMVRGLSALFWGLPLALIVCVQTAKTDILRPFNVFPPVCVTAWLCFGVWQLGSFQRQERVWRGALDRAGLLALVQLGLSPFLYWWGQVPGDPYFARVVELMAVAGLLFLASLNLVLRRLADMLPDEGLRDDTRHFTTLNRWLVLLILALGVLIVLLQDHPALLPSPPEVVLFVLRSFGAWLVLFLVLLPLAMTMALLWKIKEVILDSVFGPGR